MSTQAHPRGCGQAPPAPATEERWPDPPPMLLLRLLLQHYAGGSGPEPHSAPPPPSPSAPPGDDGELSDTKVAVYVSCSILLVLLAGVMSGLTLGWVHAQVLCVQAWLQAYLPPGTSSVHHTPDPNHAG